MPRLPGRSQLCRRCSTVFYDASCFLPFQLGGKGANLAEMSRIGLSVPPGLTITTDTCAEFHANGEPRRSCTSCFVTARIRTRRHVCRLADRVGIYGRSLPDAPARPRALAASRLPAETEARRPPQPACHAMQQIHAFVCFCRPEQLVRTAGELNTASLASADPRTCLQAASCPLAAGRTCSPA